MKTPVYDYVKNYNKKNSVRLHMPGHKGKKFLGIEEYDITEIDGADVLYSSNGIIEESQSYASKLFGTEKTLYSCEGSSLSIKAMLYLALLADNSSSKTILALRNAHKAFINASVLLDFNIEWLYSKNPGSIITCDISAQDLDKKLCEMDEKPAAFYVTSPDYLGNILDIRSFSEVCHKHNVLLLCDNAHGAYLNFLPKSKHPIFLGADICCDSAHKTLPVLTGGGYLHISKNAPSIIIENAKRAMSLFSSTSPSYLILESLDIANSYLSRGYKKRLYKYVNEVSILKSELEDKGFKLVGNEELKIAIDAKKFGWTGFEISEYLKRKNIICEFADPDFIVFMLTPENGKKGIKSLKKALYELERKKPIESEFKIFKAPIKIMSPREAAFSKTKLVPADHSEGEVLASENVSCPPAIPVVVAGEEINESCLNLFKYYNIDEVLVVEKS